MQQIRLGARLILYILRKLWGVCHFILISFLLHEDYHFSCLSTRLNIVNHSFIGRKGGICIILENAIPKRPTSLMKESGVGQAKEIADCGGWALSSGSNRRCLSHNTFAKSSTLRKQLSPKISMKALSKELCIFGISNDPTDFAAPYTYDKGKTDVLLSLHTFGHI